MREYLFGRRVQILNYNRWLVLFLNWVVLIFAANNNIGVVIALWAPIILVCLSPSLCVCVCVCEFFFTKLMLRWFPGLFYGYPDLVCNFFHIIWRNLWGIPPSGRGWWCLFLPLSLVAGTSYIVSPSHIVLLWDIRTCIETLYITSHLYSNIPKLLYIMVRVYLELCMQYIYIYVLTYDSSSWKAWSHMHVFACIF